MDFNEFALSRDLLYISSAVTGLAIGLLFSLFRKDLSRESRNRRITLAIVSFSGTITGLAITFIVSFGAVFTDMVVLIIGGGCIVLCAVAVCFPRTVAFPLILLTGLAVSWLGFSCLRFPVFHSSPALIISYSDTSDTGDVYLIKFDMIAVTSRASAGDISISGKRSFFNCNVKTVEIIPQFPFIGGKNHGFISSITSDMGQEYNVNTLNSPLFKLFYTASVQQVTGITIKNFDKTIKLDDIPQGSTILISMLPD